MYKKIKIKDIFDIYVSDKIDNINDSQNRGCVPCISGSSSNNGFIGLKPVNPLYRGNMITINNKGVSFYHGYPFSTTTNIYILEAKYKLFNKYHAFYFLTLINKNNEKYKKDTNIGISKLRNDTILVPFKNNDIDWEYIEEEIKDIYIDADEYIDVKNEKNIDLLNREWKDFYISDLFNIIRGNGDYYFKLNKGKYPFVSSSKKNNGIIGYVDKYTDKGKCITVSSGGSSPGYAFFQKNKFYCSNAVIVLRCKKNIINIYSALFIMTLINKERYRYNYYRACGVKRMNDLTIKLPVNKNNKPDWLFMENYIKSLKYTILL